MALEKLQSVFNNISENQYDLEDGIPVESISNSLYDDFHSFGTQGNRTELIEVNKISKKQNPSPLMAINGIFAEDGTRIPVNPDVNGHNFGQIRINDNNGTNLLQTVGTEHSGNKGFGQVVVNKNNEVLNFTDPYNLGEGKFVLESLFDKTHGSSTPDRIPFGEPGRLSSDLLLHASAGIGDTSNLNIRKNKGSYGGRGGEPHIVHPIGFSSENAIKTGYNRDGIPWRAAGEDLARLFNYYVSSDGIQFMLKENVTNISIGDGFTLTNPFRSLMLPPLPVPTTGFLNFYHQKFQNKLPDFSFYRNTPEGAKEIFKYNGAERGSLRKPAIRNYSDAFTRTPFRAFISANQGDVDTLLGSTFLNPIKKSEYKYRDNIKKEWKLRFDTNEKSTPKEGAGDAKILGLKALDLTTNTAGAIGNVVMATAETATNLAIEAGRRLLIIAKEEARKQYQKAIDEGVLLPKQPISNFSGLNKGPGTQSGKVIDKISLQPPSDPVTAKKFENDESNVEPGDFYVRIQDLRKNADGSSGRTLYFRGFVTGITENINPTWNPTSYLGRSEDVWIYQKAERDISFNLRVAPANATEQEYMYQKIEQLTSLAYPSYLPDGGMMRMQPPLTALYMAHIGSKSVGQFGYIKSITYTVNEQGDWDALTTLPRVFDIALSYQILSKQPPNLATTKFYNPVASDVTTKVGR